MFRHADRDEEVRDFMVHSENDHEVSAVILLIAILVLVVMPTLTAIAAPCTLTAADFTALELSPSHITTQAQVDVLPETRHGMLCSTRTHWNHIRSSGQFTDADKEYSPYYLSPDELHVYSKFVDAYIEFHILNSMTEEEWTKQRQRILDGLSR
jgi:hypothetical protein